MRRFCASRWPSLMLWIGGDAQPQHNSPAKSESSAERISGSRSSAAVVSASSSGTEVTGGRRTGEVSQVCELRRERSTDVDAASRRVTDPGRTGDKDTATELHVSGAYQISSGRRSDDQRPTSLLRYAPSDGQLLVTASMPMDEYIAGVLAGETGNFKSDEALKAMAVTARTYAMHFGSRHALDGFDFCDSTHCQNLRLGRRHAPVAEDRRNAPRAKCCGTTASRPRPTITPIAAARPRTAATSWATTSSARPT